MARQVVVDACCTLNLLATGRELTIVEALDLVLFETPQVSGEAHTLSTPPDTDGNRFKEAASAGALRAANRLQIRALASEELEEAFVAAAARIKDTDASCIALAGVMRIPLLTDDRKERTIARDLFPNIELMSTLDVIAEASGALGWPQAELVSVAWDLRWRGNFAPPRFDPRGEWYEGLLRAGK